MISFYKPNFKHLLALSVLISLSACNISTESSTKINNQNQTLKYDLPKLEKKNMGLVKVVIKGDEFSKRSGFSTKAADLANPLTRKLRLDIVGYDIEETIQTIKWSPGQTATFNVPVIAGKNRFIILTALDAGNRVLGTFMGTLDVEVGKDNPVKLNYFETIVTQTLLEIYGSDDYELLSEINLTDLKNYLKDITGYDEEKNTFSKINPAKLNTTLIGEEIIYQDGAMPTDEILEYGPLEATGSIELDLNVVGAQILISDLNSEVIVTTDNHTRIDDITLGAWDLTVFKEGFVNQTYRIFVSDLGFDINIELPEDFREDTVFNDFRKAKLNEDIVDNELGVVIRDYTYIVGSDKNGDGAEDQYGEAFSKVEGFGEHKIILNQINYPIMSNELDIIEVYDETNDQTITLAADQELQYFGLISDNEDFFVETNFDKTFSFNGFTAKTPKELTTLMLNHPLFKDISLHGIALMYELQKHKGKLPATRIESETLSPAVCDDTSNYNSYDALTEILKEAFIQKKASLSQTN